MWLARSKTLRCDRSRECPPSLRRWAWRQPGKAWVNDDGFLQSVIIMAATITVGTIGTP